MIELETVEAVHTHTHTHTLQFNEINKKATKLAFNCNRKKTDYIKKYSLSFCAFLRKRGNE